MTPMAILNLVLVAAEVLIWEETGWSAGVLFPVYAVVNVALAIGLIYAFVRLFAPQKTQQQ